MSKQKKKESSVPVQGRISIMTLAELHIYWESQGENVEKMSKLLSWSVDLLAEILRKNDLLPIQVDSVASAHNYMLEKGLYQRSLEKRSFDKIATAIRFEGMREEGVDPAQYAKHQYNTLHKRISKSGECSSVEVFEGKGISDKVKKAEEIYRQKEEEELKAAEEEEKKRNEAIWEQVRNKMAEDVKEGKYSPDEVDVRDLNTAEASASGEKNAEEEKTNIKECVMKEGEVDEDEFARREREKKEAEDRAHQEFLNSFGKK